VSIASPLALSLSLLQPNEPAHDAGATDAPAGEAPTPGPVHPEGQPVLTIHHHAHTDSVFLGSDYLIKGVAGAILWRLVRDWVERGRQDFSNRELRMDTSLGLPDVTDNLEARLILLQKRLVERNAPLRLVKTGRGRFRLQVDTPLLLVSQA
jgi:adenylate cyclase